MRAKATVAALLSAALVAACAADTYPIDSGGPGASQYAPAALGEPIDAVVLFMELRPGDRLELLSAQPVGLTDGATAEFFFSPPLLTDGGQSIGDQLEPFVGAVAVAPGPTEGPGNTFGVVARITATKPGRYELTSVRIRYRLNGGAAQYDQGIDVTSTVCADDPKPLDCNRLETP